MNGNDLEKDSCGFLEAYDRINGNDLENDSYASGGGSESVMIQLCLQIAHINDTDSSFLFLS